MFDLSISEIAIIAMIAVVVIGPKELPRALATAGKWMAKARGVMANFRTGLDAMVRESELQDMEKKWASENERIMLEHPTVDADEMAADEYNMEPVPEDTASGNKAADVPSGKPDENDSNK